MQFFIDTADIDEIKTISDLGLVDGVTTNPSLVAKTKKSYEQVVREICEICPGPVSAEVIATESEAIMKEARLWAKVASQVVVKIPLIESALPAIAACSREGIATNVTLCFSAVQALVAAKLGATYISPFVGRLDDGGQYGMEIIRDIKSIYRQYNMATKILVASLRTPLHLRDAACLGADVATLPAKLIRQVVKHPLTDLGLAQFLLDSQSIPESKPTIS